MRLRRGRRRSGEPDDGVLPLINIVFLLLIFFMVAGRLTAGDPFEIEPVVSETEGRASTDAPLLLIAADGRLAIEGAEIGRESLLAAVSASGDGRLRIKADGDVDSALVIALLADLRAAGVAEARLMTQPAAR